MIDSNDANVVAAAAEQRAPVPRPGPHHQAGQQEAQHPHTRLQRAPLMTGQHIFLHSAVIRRVSGR